MFGGAAWRALLPPRSSHSTCYRLLASAVHQASSAGAHTVQVRLFQLVVRQGNQLVQLGKHERCQTRARTERLLR